MPNDPRTTQVIYHADRQQPSLVIAAARIRVVSGPDAGASCRMALRRVRVGSASDNDLVLSDGLVSRHHLEFRVQDRGFLVVDQRSTNGTLYRGARIKEALVGPGVEVRLGDTVLRVEPGADREESVAPRPTFGGLIGDSPAMQQVYGLLAAVAPSDVTVLVVGETGTGKELVAAELHRQSPRSRGPLSIVDCGSMPASLIESELFGHAKGAFTGAVSDREGIFEKSRGGVVFLDEIGELPLELQTRLLRVLEAGTIKRLGSNVVRPVDVRIVAATNVELERAVKEKRFRQDLYYRLNVVQIRLPALRERPEDLPLLARHFLWHAGCADAERVLTPEVLAVFRSRRWPGNVRELRNVVERAVLLSDGAFELDEEPLAAPAALAPVAAGVDGSGDEEGPAGRGDQAWLGRALPPGFLDRPYKAGKELLVNQYESLYIGRLFERHGRNVSRIADDAAIDRHMVRKLLRKHGFDKPS